MKKTTVILVFASLVAVAAFLLCRPAVSAAITKPFRSSTAAPSDASLQDQVVAAERAGLDALKKGDVATFANLTADEAVLVDDHGPATKAQVVKNVSNFTLTDYTMDDIHFVPIAPNTGLISYKLTEKGNSHGHEFTAQVYISSVWTNRANNWLCLFSQETAVRKPPTPPAPAAQ
jgi:ketosteroid isomerase-like protein